MSQFQFLGLRKVLRFKKDWLMEELRRTLHQLIRRLRLLPSKTALFVSKLSSAERR
jgi:hypothetical protein